MPEQASIPAWIIPLITASLGFISALVIEKFKNRSVILKYKKSTFQLATATQHKLWGNIEVLYNNRKASHLSFITFEVKNASNVDLEKVNVDFWVDENSQILANQGNYIESGNSISLENEYAKFFQEVVDLYNVNPNINDQDYLQKSRYVLSNRKFTMSVLNRGTTAKFQLLVENFQSLIPQVSISILHKSCKLLPEEEEGDAKEKKNKQVAVVWMILYTIVIAILYYMLSDTLIIWTGLLAFATVFISPSLLNLLGIFKRIFR